jgi:cytochrome c-type biogenesis protein CcmH
VSARGLVTAVGVAVVALAALTLAAPAFAVDNTPPLSDPAMQQRYVALIHEFRCMQCQNEALADSNVSLAADLRREVHDLIKAGKSDDEIRDYLVARYGEFILFRPRMSWRNAWLWAAPGLLLLGGLAIAVRVLRQRSRLPIMDDDPPDATGGA